MADEEQLALLKQGVEVWNQWRQEHPDIRLDLSQADLSQAALHDIYHRGADPNLTDPRRIALRDAHLSGADLHRVAFSQADLRRVDLRRAALRNAHLSGADLHGADLRGAVRREVT